MRKAWCGALLVCAGGNRRINVVAAAYDFRRFMFLDRLTGGSASFACPAYRAMAGQLVRLLVRLVSGQQIKDSALEISSRVGPLPAFWGLDVVSEFSHRFLGGFLAAMLLDMAQIGVLGGLPLFSGHVNQKLVASGVLI